MNKTVKVTYNIHTYIILIFLTLQNVTFTQFVDIHTSVNCSNMLAPYKLTLLYNDSKSIK